MPMNNTKILYFNRIDVSEKMLIKQANQKNVIFVPNDIY